MMRDRADITIAIRKEVMYLPSNGAIAKFVHRDLDLHFQGHNLKCQYLDNGERLREMLTFIDIHIRHRIVVKTHTDTVNIDTFM